VGDGCVQCLTWHLVPGGIVSPPFHRLGRACTLPSAHVAWHYLALVGVLMDGHGEALQYTNVHGNFKIKFQTYIFEIIFKDNFIRLLFAYTTSVVYLT
jgi:hypothetical protein